jgi:excinuclease ABC subunit A
MKNSTSASIKIQNAREHNLQNITLDIPHNQLIVVTGVSGSGKSSLAFDVIASEGQSRYLTTFSTFARQYAGKISHPAVDSIEGLFPVISLGQKTTGVNPRSTVGTISDIYDYIRLLFARLGKGPDGLKLSRSLFSFNAEKGACKACTGLGLEERISIEKLITDPSKSLRQGVLAPSLPNGYIMYSQVTLDVLDKVCNAHGFSVDIPWVQLTDNQKDVVLYGSTLIKIPFGKHPLENRLKWTGITAKPREEGFYRGLVPIMSEILKRDRNENILRYVESVRCSQCGGKRLNPEALSVKLKGKTIDCVVDMEIRSLKFWLEGLIWETHEIEIAKPVIEKINRQIGLLENLGMGHVSLSRSAKSLSGGESQRLRLVNQVSSELSHILYVFDEPSIGMHPSDKVQMIDILRILISYGNSVIVVEHDETFIRNADWIIDIGPGAGEHGGKLLFNGKVADFLAEEGLKGLSPTFDALTNIADDPIVQTSDELQETIVLSRCTLENLKEISVHFVKSSLNVVTGVSGSGKNALVLDCSKRQFSTIFQDTKL